MARINIEDCWWTDPRRSKLIKLMAGDELQADGLAVKMWRLAQEFWGRGRQQVPLEIFETLEANAKLIEAKLAKVEGEYVYVRGSSQYLDWHAERREAARIGGVKSGETRRKKATTKQPVTRSKREANASKLNQTQPSGSGSLSDSDSDSVSGSSSPVVTEAGASAPIDLELNARIWKAYSEAYQSRYHTKPVRNAKVNGQISQLGKRLGAEAPDVAEFYLRHDKTFYVSKLHDLGLLLSDAEALRTQWFHGRAITQTDIRRFEKSAAARDINRMIDEGEIK